MIEKSDVLNIHSILIDKFGGSKGVQDLTVLESAINRPYATFDNVELYPKPSEKAAAILESILINHPFIDGNKRTAFVLMKLLLLKNSIEIKATQEELYTMIISASSGEMRFSEIAKWIEDRILEKNLHNTL
jgi:death-on-curing protein